VTADTTTLDELPERRTALGESVVRTGLGVRLKQMPRAALAIIGSLFVLACSVYGRVDTTALLLWGSMVTGGAIARWIQSAHMLKRIDTESAENLRRDDFYGAFSILVHSAIVGSAFWLVATTEDSIVNMNITLASVFFTVPTIIGAATRYWMVSFGAIANVGQGVLFWFGLGANHEAEPAIAVMLLATLVLFVTMTRIYAAQFRDSVRIRTENIELLSRLTTEKKTAEFALRQARDASETKSRFLAAASHDLRQPLHALTMFLGTLSFHVTTDDAKRILSRIKDTVLVLEEQFNSLLDLSRFDAGAIAAEIKPFRIDISVDRLIDEMRPIAEAKNLALIADVYPAVAKSDPILFGRMLRNLLDNALKYTVSGSVRVRVTKQSIALLVEVVDTGPGIPADQQTRIFDEYVQLTNPARLRQHGVGLGLAIVKRIDMLLGLKLSLQSIVGVGSQFSFLVPAAARDEIDPQIHRTSFDTTIFKTSAAIWILDDDLLALESMQGQLSTWGANVTVFSRPEELLEELRSGAPLPDWICTDDMLGAALSGLETAQILLREFQFPRVCLITGNTEPMRLMELRSSGFPVIVKPARPDDLIAVISTK
jgi:signal transduction histidine kinase